MNMIYKRSLMILISVITLTGITGCQSILSRHMPSGGVSMAESYRHAMNNAIDDQWSQFDALRYARHQLHVLRPQLHQNSMSLLDVSRLENPTIEMYVYAHEVGSGENRVPIPGYSTVFPLYSRTYYLLNRNR